MKKKLIPLAGYVLIEAIDEGEQRTSRNLVLPEKAKEKPMRGKVIEVGKQITHFETTRSYPNGETYYASEKCQVEKGDICIFHRWSGQDVKEEDKEYKLVKFSDIMGKYE